MQLDNPDAKLVDVASGTGDVASRFYKFSRSCGYCPDVTAVDPNEAMLCEGKKKALNEAVVLNYVQADAQMLPFADNVFDYYTISFGIRNVQDRHMALAEAYRVLKPGGKMVCLEFSKPVHGAMKALYKLHAAMIPMLGQVVTRNRDAYQYLIDSIEAFPDQEEFVRQIMDAGFCEVSYRNLTGGVAAIHTGFKKECVENAGHKREVYRGYGIPKEVR